ncbi:MAG: hypothetical protein C0614_12530 [Desulfuromonas sp.]|nr:MAG: hypothetical protein C0614_12530 [Desulfuromonas sp.]
MTDRSLTEIIDGMIQADQIRLPVLKEVAEHVLASLAQEEMVSSTLSSLAGRDPALVSELFRSANSSFFQGLPKTRLLNEAIARLGIEKCCTILEGCCQTALTFQSSPLLEDYLPKLWQHAMGCACGAQWLAVRCGYQAIGDQAYLAGLLHDIGKLFMLAALQQISRDDIDSVNLSPQIVSEVIEAMHTGQGQRLVTDWNLPEFIGEVVSDHHDQAEMAQNMTLALVNLANKGCHKIGLGLLHLPDMVLPTTAEAQFLGVDEIALAEFEIMLEDRFLNTGS